MFPDLGELNNRGRTIYIFNKAEGMIQVLRLRKNMRDVTAAVQRLCCEGNLVQGILAVIRDWFAIDLCVTDRCGRAHTMALPKAEE